MYSHIDMMGIIIDEPTFRRTRSGTPVCWFTIACERDIAVDGKRKETDYIGVATWNETAEFVINNFSKWMPILVSGRLQTRHWEDRDGNLRATTEIVAETVAFAGEEIEDEYDEPEEQIINVSKELTQHRREIEALLREEYGAPSEDDLFNEGELKTIPPELHSRVRKQRTKWWFEKKGIPNPNEMISQDEMDNLSVEEIDDLLGQRSIDWFKEAMAEQEELTEKNIARYFFEQRTIPTRLFSGDGKVFIATLPKLGGKYLYSLLVIKENLRVGGGYKCPYGPEDFGIKTRKMRTTDNKQLFGILIIDMPNPKSVPLCSKLIICHDQNYEQICYYTIEKALGSDHFMLCGVDEDLTHLNYGDAPCVESDILERICELYTKRLNRE